MCFLSLLIMGCGHWNSRGDEGIGRTDAAGVLGPVCTIGVATQLDDRFRAGDLDEALQN